MGREDMPPMVVSSRGRYFDIEPYGNRLCAADPIVWGSIFPWEFPQDGTRQQEEAFLRKWFTLQEIHVQGGVGDRSTPGEGYRFLKQVWYSQAIWNWEHRVPALNDWWWKNAEAAGLINDPSVQKYILAPNVELKTFFQSEELEMYGEKFLQHVIPVIRQTAKAKIEEQNAAKKNEPNIKTTRTLARVPEGAPASEPSTAVLDDHIGMHALTKVSSQPVESKSEIVMPAEAQRSLPQSAAPEPARPRVISAEYQPPAEQSPFSRKRGNTGSRRYSNRGGQPQTRQMYPSHEHDIPAPMPVHRSVSGTSTASFDGYSQYGPAGPLDFTPPPGRGQSVVPDPYANFYPSHQLPTIGLSRHPIGFHPATFAPPFDGQQPQVIWARNPLLERGTDFNRHSMAEHPRDGGFTARVGKRRGISGDYGRGRGRGTRGGRGSFCSQGQAPPIDFPRYTSYEYNGPGSASKARRGSVISTETKNWRSSSDHPQAQINDENVAPRGSSKYVPAPNPFDTKSQYQLPAHVYPHAHLAYRTDPRMQGKFNLPDYPRYHCTETAIGDLCPYAVKLIVFNVPIQAKDEELRQFFGRFGRLVELNRRRPSSLRNDEYQQTLFAVFASSDDARRCFNNKPDTWLMDNRPLRLGIPKEYWDPSHDKYSSYRSNMPVMTPRFEPNHAFLDPSMQGSGPVHRSHDSASAIRGPTVNTGAQATGSRETTPTASGTNTPKKRNRKSTKNEARNKQPQHSRAPSLSESVEEKNDEPPRANQDAIAESTDDSHTTKLPQTAPGATADRPIDTDMNGSTSENFEKSTTPTTTVTSDDEVVNRLPITDEVSKAQDNEIASNARIVVSTSNNADVQTSVEPPPSADETDDVQPPADSVAAAELFREHEEETQASTATARVSNDAERPGLQRAGPTDGDAVPTIKAEDDQVDDSFHTATGSPSSAKGASGDALKSKSLTDDGAAVSSAAASENDPSQARDESQKALPSRDTDCDPNTSVDPDPLAIDTASAAKGKKGESPKRSGSAGSALVFSGAFVTAPNTPIVDQEPGKAPAAKTSSNTQSKKAEKSKGPAQTESFSLFGKKTEKKAKPQKKGTLKGKPKELAGASSSSATAPPSGSSKPAVECAEAGQTNKRDEKADGASARLALEKSDENKPPAAPIDVRAAGPTRTPPSLAATLPRAEGELSKKPNFLAKTFGRLITGSNTQSNPQEKPNAVPKSVQTVLTDVKDTLGSAGPETNEATSGGQGMSAVGGADKTQEDRAAGSINNALSSSDIPLKTSASHNTGLGISNASDDEGQAEVKPKKKRKKPKKKSKKAADDVTEYTPEATPEPDDKEGSKGERPFRFTFQAPTPESIQSTRSDASSNTVGEATPSTANSSPNLKKPRRRIPFAALSTGNVLHEKEPQWKNKKRIYRSSPSPDEPSDDEKSNYPLESVDSKNSNVDTDSGEPMAISVGDTASGTQETPRALLWLNPKRTNIIVLHAGSKEEEASQEAHAGKSKITDSTADAGDNDDSGERNSESENSIVKEGKAKMQRLMEQESRRKHGGKASPPMQLGGPGWRERAPTQDEASRIEELGKLYPGRTIVLIQQVDGDEDE